MNTLLHNYIKPFRESEATAVSNIDTTSLIDQHQQLIEIVEAIQHFQMAKRHTIQSIEGFGGTFPRLRKKYIHNIDIYNRCINRLKERYSRINQKY